MKNRCGVKKAVEPLGLGGEAGGLSRELCVLGISKAWELLRVSALRKVGGGAACEP